jgi:hypothetical protein
VQPSGACVQIERKRQDASFSRVLRLLAEATQSKSTAQCHEPSEANQRNIAGSLGQFGGWSWRGLSLWSRLRSGLLCRRRGCFWLRRWRVRFGRLSILIRRGRFGRLLCSYCRSFGIRGSGKCLLLFR